MAARGPTATGFLAALDEGERSDLLGRGRRRRYRRGAVVFHEGGGSDEIVVVLSGRVKVSTVTADGKEVVDGQMNASDLAATTDLRAVLKGLLKDHLRVTEAPEAPELEEIEDALTNVIDPEVFVIGGGISRSWALIEPTIVETLHSSPFIKPARRPRVRRARLGDRAGQVGAVEWARINQ